MYLLNVFMAEVAVRKISSGKGKRRRREKEKEDKGGNKKKNELKLE